MDLKSGNTHDEFLALRRELEQLGGGLEAWREHLALREEISFYAAKIEEFARRLLLLEKKLALQRNGETVPIRMSTEAVAEQGKEKPGGPETAVDAERLAA